jgi:DNA (cytosine-5)-methyltransferase 1
MLRLMSFPDDFVIDGSRADVQRQLGNAVPVELGKAVVRSLVTQLGILKPHSAARAIALG